MKTLRFCALILCLCCSAVFGADVYAPHGVELSDGAIQLARGGRPIFSDRFETADAWPEIVNYRGVLEMRFGAENDDQSSLFVTRTSELNPDDPEDYVTAWNVSTSRRPLAPRYVGRDYALRMESVSSKRTLGCAADDRTWRGGIEWYDESEELIEAQPFLYDSSTQPKEIVLYGTIPEGAAFYEIRIGFDIPDFAPGDFTALRSVSLQIIDPVKPYLTVGDFKSAVCKGGTFFSWDAETPKGCAVKFQIAATENIDGVVDDLSEFVGPDGTDKTYFERPFEIKSPFFRYRAVLTSEGTDAPKLRSVTLGKNVDSEWNFSGDADPPLVKIAGEYATPSLKKTEPLALEIIDRSYVARSSLKITVDDVDETDRFKVDASNKKPGQLVLTAKFDKPFDDGLHVVKVDASDRMNNSVVSTRWFLIGTAPATPKISVRDDGATLIDGEPFFPVGLFGVAKKKKYNDDSFDVACRQLKDAGFNFAHAYFGGHTDEFLQAAEKYGLKVWTSAEYPDERFVEIERHSPAVLAWYLGDDTNVYMTPSQLLDRYYSVKAVDPTRLTVQADFVDSDLPISVYRRFVTGTDAFLPEIYSLDGVNPEKDAACVARIVKDVKQCRADVLDANDGPKSIWPIVQCFKGWWVDRFPTYQEQRAMSFAAIAADADGITWFFYSGSDEEEDEKQEYGAITSPEIWADLSKVAKQISELSPVLLERTEEEKQPQITVLEGDQENPLGQETIVGLVKRHDGRAYLIAVNTSPNPCAARFDFEEKRIFDGFQTLFDESDKTPTFKNGGFEESFEPFGVRIYSWNDN
ncbi:MAG: hypothetical protein IK077_15850 [Thermoguttaceae bacterium]|nr:hypothetical protein [Thermoguttaceae bacterium]